MTVFCPNKERGCQLTMTWKTLNEHLQQCDYESIRCSSDGCSVTMMRSKLAQHLKTDCVFVRVQCQFCNDDVIKRDMLAGHETMCANKERFCRWQNLGCQFKGKPSDLKNHESDLSVHQVLVFTSLTTLQSAVTSIRGELQQVKEENYALKQKNESLAHENQSLRDATAMQLKQQEKVQASQNVALQQLKDQSSSVFNDVHRKIVATNDVLSVHDASMQNMRKQTEEIGANLKNRLDGVDQSLQAVNIRFSENEIRFRCLECGSHDGTLVWKIVDYSRRKQDAVDGRTLSLYSQPFHSSQFGYKMCVRVYLNGDGMGRGTHLSLFFVVMRGEYDALLPWPFRQRVSLTLLDQKTGKHHITDTFRADPTSTSFRRPISEMNVASGCPMFAQQTIVETDTYLQKDSIFFKIQVHEN